MQFAATLLVIDAALIPLAIFGLDYGLASDEWKWALLVADLNALAGFWLLVRNLNKPINTLYAAVMGGMFLRMIGLGIVLWIAFVKAGFSKFGFTIVLFVAYIFKSVAEVIFIRIFSRN